jgi:uncharacterized membrane protein
MLLDLTLAISHHLLIFILFGILVAELIIVAPGIGGKEVGPLVWHRRRDDPCRWICPGHLCG